MQAFRGLAFTKFTIFTAASKTSLRVAGVPLVARASRWMLQCSQVVSGATAWTCVSTPLCFTVMALRHLCRCPHILKCNRTIWPWIREPYFSLWRTPWLRGDAYLSLGLLGAGEWVNVRETVKWCFTWKHPIYYIKAVLTSSLVYDRCLDSNSKKWMHYFTFILPVQSYLLHYSLRWLPEMHCHVTDNWDRCNVKPYKCPHVRPVIMRDTRDILCSFIT